MKKIIWIPLSILIAILLIGLAVNQIPSNNDIIVVSMKNNEGVESGTIKLSETRAGVLIDMDLKGLSPDGEHGFHIHEKADCTPLETFKNAGGHYNPMDKAHGLKHPEGEHVGDMPNIRPNDKGEIATQILNVKVTLNEETEDAARVTLFDEDGSSLMVHADADDHMSQPSGAAGPRILCGEIIRP